MVDGAERAGGAERLDGAERAGDAGRRAAGRPYHHGDLRRALLDAAVQAIGEAGPAALSLREVARRVQVSHAAPAHHFGDKAGLLAAVAGEGYRLLADALREAYERTGSFLEVGVAYVRFAVTHRAHFDVMFRPELYGRDHAAVAAARQAAGAVLYAGAGAAVDGVTRSDRLHAGVAAWSLVHGLATLWVNGNLPPELGDDPEAAARATAAYLFAAPRLGS